MIKSGKMIISNEKGHTKEGTFTDVDGFLIIEFGKKVYKYVEITKENIEELFEQRKILFTEVKRVNKRIMVAENLLKWSKKDA